MTEASRVRFSACSARYCSHRAIASVDRSRPEVERLRMQVRDHRDLRVHSRPAGVLERPFERVGARAPAARVDVGLALQPPGPGEPEVVAELLELGNRPRRRRGSRRAPSPPGCVKRPEELALDHRAQLEPAVAGRGGGLQCLGQNILGPCEVAGPHEGAAELGAGALAGPDVPREGARPRERAGSPQRTASPRATIARRPAAASRSPGPRGELGGPGPIGPSSAR